MALALATATLVALPTSPAQSAVGDSGSTSGAAVFATDGDGRYKDRIGWISWGAHGANIPAGAAVTNWHQTGVTERLEVTCTIESRTGTIRAYRPGDWANDGLTRLYRRGATNTHVTGIGTVNQGDSRGFRISCTARLATYASSAFTGSPTATTTVPLAGLVMADAESTNSTETSYAQPVQASGTSWHIIDRYAGTCGSTYRGIRVDSSNRLTFSASGECSGTNAYSATAVAFIAGSTSLDVQLNGTGLAAMSFGYLLGVDYGDAPASYGASAAVVQPMWSGGTVGTTQTTITGSGAITPAAIGAPVFRLGPNAFPNTTPPHSALANGDTGWAVPDATTGVTTQTPDEDAFAAGNVPNEITVVRGATTTYTLANVRCARPTGTAASVRGWIDWNRNGVFDANEGSTGTTGTACGTGANATVTLSFAVPSTVLDGVTVGGDRTFLRLRFSSTPAQLSSATATLVQGEVEDWPLLLRVPKLEVTKTANVDTVPSSGGTVTYTVTATNVGNGSYTASQPAYVYDYYGAADDDAVLGTPVPSAPGDSGQDAGNHLLWWSGALSAGSQVTFSIPMTVRPSPGDLVMTNIVRVSNTALTTAQARAQCVAGSPEATARVCARSDLYRVGLEVTKRAYLASDGSFSSPIADASALAPGTPVVWRYTVRNTGSITLTGIQLSDIATDTKTDETGITTVTSSPTISCSGNPAVTSGTTVTIPSLAGSTERVCQASGVIGGT